MRVVLQQWRNIEHVGQFLHPLPPLAARLVTEAKTDVGGDVEMRKQREILKDHAHPALFHRHQQVAAADSLLVKLDLAGQRPQKTGDGTQQGGLAAAAGPRQTTDFALAEDDRDAARAGRRNRRRDCRVQVWLSCCPGRERDITRLIRITGIMPAATMASAGTAASARRSSLASS